MFVNLDGLNRTKTIMLQITCHCVRSSCSYTLCHQKEKINEWKIIAKFASLQRIDAFDVNTKWKRVGSLKCDPCKC